MIIIKNNGFMKKTFLLFLLLGPITFGFGSKWIGINRSTPVPATISLLSSDLTHSTVHFTVEGFNLSEVMTPAGPSGIITIPKGSPVETGGSPDLPKLTASLVIPDQGSMEAVVVSSSYTEYSGFNIAPSKGVISRETDPATVPYRYGSDYGKDAFFPGTLAGMRDPYILRDLRGQTLIVYPFQYNPVTKILRVYHDLTIEVRKVTDKGMNTFTRKTNELRVNREFEAIYSRHFLNYRVINYVPLNDYGNILVISYGAFMDAMQPYVNWKNSTGFPTTMVNIDSIGTTSADIKQYITNYYDDHGLTFVLLVGDNAQIPTYSGYGVGGPSDNYYGYILGNDHYADVFIGRFSAENTTQVSTQVQRTLDYERNPQYRQDDWLTSVIGIGSDQGPGDDNEYDFQHIRHQETELLNYTYTSNPELFDGSQGGNDAPGNPSPALVTAAVNDGASLILYCGHGSMTSWGTTGFSNSNVTGLTNQGKLPLIWSVACVNGQFMSGTCFAEAWMRATKNGEPTGAMAFLGSTINQSWNSPMAGQDEMTDILVESYPANIKRTFGGLSMNGCMLMIDQYGSDGANMADTWTIFGDPSLMVRTSNPDTLIVSHPLFLRTGDSSLTVSCNKDGARATLLLHDTILATGLIAGDTLHFIFPALNISPDSILLTVSNYNSIPYQAYIAVSAPVTADFSGTPTHVITGGSVSFTDLSTGIPLSWSWSFPGGEPDHSTLQNPVVTYNGRGTYDVVLIVSNIFSSDTLTRTSYIESDFPAQVGETAAGLSFTISPNPNNGSFRIMGGSVNGGRVSYRLINAVGTVAYEAKDIHTGDRLDISVTLPDLKEGLYFLSLTDGNGTMTKKIVIRK
jgi:hypothetical protein